eukprot:GHVU01004576.1.p1 GENE.GHVU01004576.1~~GHVU01004576.1.p1  ORF type:complete len:405 (-),score=56.92 GHVU01004576.1:218-1432(-)
MPSLHSCRRYMSIRALWSVMSLGLLVLIGGADAFHGRQGLRSRTSFADPVRLARRQASAATGQLQGQPLRTQARAATEKAVGSNPPTGRRTDAVMSVPIDLKGKVAFVAGVGDSSGYGWAIAKALSHAGATVAVGTWPPVYNIFTKSLESGKFKADMLFDDAPGESMKIEKVYPLDAVFDTPEDVPDEVRANKRYAGVEGFTVSETASKVKRDFGGLDILVHSLANGPEVTKPLLQTSRRGYLAAQSASAYSLVSLVQQMGPIMRDGGSVVSLSYIASERTVPGYGGGMSGAKAALESDTRVLAYEAGRAFGVRVNTISAGPLKSRAAQAIGTSGTKSFIDYAIDYSRANAPLQKELLAEDVGSAALFLLSPMARAVTGVTLHVDNGLHSMAVAVDSKAWTGDQ